MKHVETGTDFKFLLNLFKILIFTSLLKFELEVATVKKSQILEL